jgi:hypothetical protein
MVTKIFRHKLNETGHKQNEFNREIMKDSKKQRETTQETKTNKTKMISNILD